MMENGLTICNMVVELRPGQTGRGTRYDNVKYEGATPEWQKKR